MVEEAEERKETSEPAVPFVPAVRIGHGYDAHRFAAGRRLVLGGVEIPHEMGLDGHSDADAALHALMDALLGALALGDIGSHFPDTDEAYRGADSLLLLGRVSEIVFRAGYRVGNVDCTIIAQAPKLAPYLDAMRRAIAKTLRCEASAVSIKATTEEHMGFTGRLEGIAAHAVCTLFRA